MTEPTFGNAISKFVGAPLSAAAGTLISWSAARSTGAVGPAAVALLSILGGICTLALTLIYRRYIGILGADRRRPAERQAYDALRNSLSGGNLAIRLYNRSLANTLDRVEHYFGDAGMAHRTLFPKAFGLRQPVPLWTAPAFDRCLLFAFTYPFLAILIVWAISGHVGPAESALRLKPNLPGWQRGLALTTFVTPTFLLCWIYATRQSRKFTLMIMLSVIPISIAVWSIFLDPAVVLLMAATTVAIAFCFQKTPTYASVTAITCNCLMQALSGMSSLFVMHLNQSIYVQVFLIICGGLLVVVCVYIIFSLLTHLLKKGMPGIFFCIFMPAGYILCLSAAGLLSSSIGWEFQGPMILILGLLTFANAPFDWFALGMTRALLRRGLELGGWWPYLLSLVDGVLAASLVVILTLVIVFSIQVFNSLASHSGGSPILNLEKILDGVALYPAAPEYWWLYALLISSMINLVIGGTSLLRGMPGLPPLLLEKIPAQGNVLKWDRAWIATVLTGQVAVGAALGIAAQVLLAAGIIGYIMPLFGLELLGMARDVAAFNLPMRTWQLLGHFL